MQSDNSKPFIVAASGFLLLISTIVLFRGIPLALRGRVDFSQLYTTGYMARSGHASSIYDYSVEEPIYKSVVPPEGLALPFDHPAYETLLFIPFSLLKYRNAYFSFLVMNVALLSICIVILRPRLYGLTGIWELLPIAIFVCFMPITIALGQGQDSLLLLALVAGAVVAIDNGKEEVAGALAGAALFKFQFTVPIVVLFFLWRRWRFVAGFAATGLLAAALSVFMVGWRGIIALAYRLGSISVGLSSAADQAKFGVRPSAMANVRGLCYVLFSSFPRGAQIATVVVSAGLLIYAARRKPSFDLAILLAALVSYHGLIHDMSLLSIPSAMMLSAGYSASNHLRICTAAVLLIAPTLLVIMGIPFFLLAIPMIAALVIGFDDLPPRLPLHRASVRK